MFNNFGDRDLNKRILRKLGYSQYAKAIEHDFSYFKRHYVVLNLSALLESTDLRLATNLFGENTPYVEFY